MINDLAQALSHIAPNWAVVVIFTLAFLEACPGIGLFISGILLLATATSLVTNDVLGLTHIVLCAFSGAFIADHLGFYLGRKVGPRFHHSRFAQKQADRIVRTESLLRRFGPAAVLVGRLVPAVRSITPLMLGITGLSRQRFTWIDLLACALWSALLGTMASGISVALD